MASTAPRLAAGALVALLYGCAAPGPKVVEVTPPADSVKVPTRSVIAVTFSEPVDAGAITPDLFRVETTAGRPVAGRIVYSEGARTATFVPQQPLGEAVYTATVSGLQDPAAQAPVSNVQWQFAVGSVTAHVSWDRSPEPGVNAPGGGYSVYYSRRPAFARGEPDVIRRLVPYRDGPYAPTRVAIDLPSLGVYYFRVSAFVMGATGEPLEGPLSAARSVSLP